MTYDPATYWPERYARQGETYVAQGGRRSSYDRQIELVTPYFAWLPTEGRVLDFGCGPGRFRPALEARGLTYDGFDIIPRLGTVETVEPGHYDCAVALYVLQHIVDWWGYQEAIETLHGCLKTDGLLLVVDAKLMEESDCHMEPRGIATLLGESRFGLHASEPIDDDHWLGVFTR